MASSFTAAQRNSMLDAVRTGYNAGKLRIYAGSVPANADAALGGATLLAELTLNATAFPAASGGVLTANAITGDSAADATGTASFFRILDSTATTVLAQGAVAASGAELNMVISVVAGVAVNISSFTITIPA